MPAAGIDIRPDGVTVMPADEKRAEKQAGREAGRMAASG
jgi:hypothetical protein